jgi:hypothetical protein
MTTVDDRDLGVRPRRLFVAWQDPERRSIEPVASLATVVDRDGRHQYRFAYLRRARELDGFEPFTAFPDLSVDYYSDELFPFFANRLMARSRTDYEAMLSLLDLSVEAEPFEVLARSGGRRATDQIEVFPEPTRDENGRATCIFFVRGLRYFEGSEDVAEELKVNEEMRILTDHHNPVNRWAVLVAQPRNGDLKLLGYVPDYLASHTQRMLSECGPALVQVTVEHVNVRETPRHMRVLCRMTSCWPPGYEPFDDPGYRAISSS